MSRRSQDDRRRWQEHDGQLRDPLQVAAQWLGAAEADPELLRFEVRGAWWEALEETGQTLLVTREYEHLAMALRATEAGTRLSYMRLPHPSGVAVDEEAGRIHLACTRNPNMVLAFGPASDFERRPGWEAPQALASALLPVHARYLPGCLYLHDLALVGGRLHANAVAMNAVVELPEAGGFRTVWWPASVDGPDGPRLDRNYLQLNSIAAGADLEASYFTASADRPSFRRPGHRNFPVDGRGVVFSGRTRGVVARGLTRPHSARLVDGELWVDNSGYGELGRVDGGAFRPVVRLPGWTRGLCAHRGVAFVGTSRVIPRFRHYAPGLDEVASVAGVHAVDLAAGRILGSLIWPAGNQVFAVELCRGVRTCGFPLEVGARRAPAHTRAFFFLGRPAGRDR